MILGIGTQKNLSADERREQGRIHLRSYFRDMRKLGENTQYLVLGTIKALFESCICLFVFLWTPALDHHNPPLGLVFASFMAANLIGSFLHQCLSARLAAPRSLLVGALATGAGAVLACALSTAPTQEFPIVSFAAFLVFELAAGFYFPTMQQLQRQHGGGALDARVVSAWFNIPVNLLACAGLLVLHSSTNTSGTRHIFFGCCLTLTAAAFMTMKLKKSAAADDVKAAAAAASAQDGVVM